ncbi:hypothetical protein ASE00_04440 [Sphingomonas sp. Root710]|nr:hypothetical protein ASE00_04440 [Sphingomonas sp. Root710]
MIRIILYGILMWGVCLYAFRRGGWAERSAAVGIVVNSYMTTAATMFLTSSATRYHRLEVSIMLVDLGLLLVLLYVTIRSDKFWPLWLTAMQSLVVLAHLAPYVPHMIPWGYWRAVAVWSWPMLVVLAFAIHRHTPRRSAGSGLSE